MIHTHPNGRPVLSEADHYAKGAAVYLGVDPAHPGTARLAAALQSSGVHPAFVSGVAAAQGESDHRNRVLADAIDGKCIFPDCGCPTDPGICQIESISAIARAEAPAVLARMFIVHNGNFDKDGTPCYSAFETKQEAIDFARDIGAAEVVEMEIQPQDTTRPMPVLPGVPSHATARQSHEQTGGSNHAGPEALASVNTARREGAGQHTADRTADQEGGAGTGPSATSNFCACGRPAVIFIDHAWRCRVWMDGAVSHFAEQPEPFDPMTGPIDADAQDASRVAACVDAFRPLATMGLQHVTHTILVMRSDDADHLWRMALGGLHQADWSDPRKLVGRIRPLRILLDAILSGTDRQPLIDEMRAALERAIWSRCDAHATSEMHDAGLAADSTRG